GAAALSAASPTRRVLRDPPRPRPGPGAPRADQMGQAARPRCRAAAAARRDSASAAAARAPSLIGGALRRGYIAALQSPPMSDPKPRSDALVFFGATGDLAYKKIFPALHAMARRGRLDFPVVGVANSGGTRDDLVARAHASVTASGGVDD